MKQVLVIQHSRETLVVTISPFKAWRNGFHWTSNQPWNLEVDARPKRRCTRGGNIVAQYPYHDPKMGSLADAKRPITHLVLLGESALNKTLLKVARDAFRGWSTRSSTNSVKNDTF